MKKISSSKLKYCVLEQEKKKSAEIDSPHDGVSKSPEISFSADPQIKQKKTRELQTKLYSTPEVCVKAVEPRKFLSEDFRSDKHERIDAK